MLASYTRAINNQQKWNGSLFRKETKAICLTHPDGISPAWYRASGITRINIVSPEKEYPNMCFNYILFNPVKDGFVNKPEDWEFSSYCEISENRNASLVDKTRIKEYGLEVSAVESGRDSNSHSTWFRVRT